MSYSAQDEDFCAERYSNPVPSRWIREMVIAGHNNNNNNNSRSRASCMMCFCDVVFTVPYRRWIFLPFTPSIVSILSLMGYRVHLHHKFNVQNWFIWNMVHLHSEPRYFPMWNSDSQFLYSYRALVFKYTWFRCRMVIFFKASIFWSIIYPFEFYRLIQIGDSL